MVRPKKKCDPFQYCWWFFFSVCSVELIHEIIIMNECCWMERVFFKIVTLQTRIVHFLDSHVFGVYIPIKSTQPRWRNDLKKRPCSCTTRTLYLISIYSSSSSGKFFFNYMLPLNKRLFVDCQCHFTRCVHFTCCIFVLKWCESYDQRKNNIEIIFSTLVIASELYIRWFNKQQMFEIYFNGHRDSRVCVFFF